MKDNHTIQHEPQRVRRWCQLTRGEIEMPVNGFPLKAEGEIASNNFDHRRLAAEREALLREAYEFKNKAAPFIIYDPSYWLYGQLPEEIPPDYCDEDPSSLIAFQERKIEEHRRAFEDAYIPFLMPWYGTGVLASGFGVGIKFMDRADPVVELAPIVALHCQTVRPDLTLRYVNDGHLNQTIYGALFGRSPEGLSIDKVTDIRFLDNEHKDKDRDGGPITKTFSLKERNELQRIAWEGLTQFEEIICKTPGE